MAILRINSTGSGAASVPDATTEVVGKVRLATVIEAATGTSESIAVTPAGLAVSLSGIVGGMTYKGVWDAINAVPDLSNAEQGDFYKISGAGTRYGKTWDVGDMLVVNADMGGTIDGAKLDKIDNTELVSNLGDLLDVTLSSPADGQGLVYDKATSQWVNSAIVEVLDDLGDVALNALTSSAYSNSTTSAGLVNLRDHITEIGAGLTAIRTIPTSLGATNILLVSNIGLGEVELQVAGSAVFSVGGSPSTAPITISAQTRATLTGSDVEGQVRWQVSTTALAPRQSLTRVGSASWTNGYINAYDVQGVASQGEINNIQAELNATQAGAGLASDGSYTERTTSNYLNSSTSLYSADTLLDSALKSEATTRASADSTLQSNINAEASARASADTTLQNNINAEASTRASADSAEASTRASADSALQAELDATQVGAGLNANGSYSAPTSSNYLGSADSLKNADSLLDTQLKSVADDVATLGGQLVASVNTITPVAGDVTLTATDISGFATVATSGLYTDLSGAPVLADVATSGAGADVSVAHTATNYTAASPDLEAHLAGIDTQLGVGLVTSVNNIGPVGGNVTLTAADLSLATVATSGLYTDLSGAPVLADVATSGLYTDLSGTPTLATVATSGAYTDLSGTPTLATVATSGAAGDVSVSATPTNYTAASANVEAHLAGVDSVLGTLGGSTVTSVNTVSPVGGDVTLTAQDLDTSHTATNYSAAGASVTEHLAGVDSALGDKVASVNTVTPVAGDVTLTAQDLDTSHTATNYSAAGASITEHLAGVDSALGLRALSADLATVATSGAYTDLSGTPTLATVATSGAYTDLSGTPTLATVATSGAAGDVSVSATPTNYTAASANVEAHLAGVDSVLGTLGGSTVTSVNGISPVGGNVTVTATDITGFATVATSGAYSDLSGKPTLATVATSGLYTDLSGTPTLATVATSGLYTDLSGTPTLAAVATSGAYSDLTGTPTLGTSAAENVGTAVGDVVQLVDVGGVAGLPAIDASNVTGLDYLNMTNVPKTFVNGLSFVTDANALTLVAGTQYIVSTASGSTKVLTLPTGSADVADGDLIRVTNWGLGRLKLTTGGSNTCYLLSGQDVVGGATAGELYIESKCTVDLVGFNYVAGGLLPAWGAYFISSIEVNTRSFTTTGQAIVYNATTKKLEGGSAGDLSSAYSPTNYTVADSKFDSYFAGIDTELGLKAVAADVLLKANDLSDLADVATARTNLGLGTAALADTGTGDGNVVVLSDVGGTVKLPAVDGSLLTGIVAPPATYESKSANFTAAVDYHYSVSTTSGNVTATLPALSGLSNGKAIRFKLYDATNNLLLSPAGSDTIDGLSSYTLTNPKQAITLIKGANDWEIF